MVALFKPLSLNPTYLKSRSTSRGQIVLTNLNEPRTDGFLHNIYPYLQRVNDQLQAFEQTSLNVLLSHASAAADRETNRLKFAGEALAGDRDYVSPLTQTAYKRGKRLGGKPVKEGLVEKLGAQQAPFKCSSPFVATSGRGDSFSTATECVVFRVLHSFLLHFLIFMSSFSENAAPSLGLGNAAILPSLLVSDPFHQTLNAAIVDFYIHGDGEQPHHLLHLQSLSATPSMSPLPDPRTRLAARNRERNQEDGHLRNVRATPCAFTHQPPVMTPLPGSMTSSMCCACCHSRLPLARPTRTRPDF